MLLPARNIARFPAIEGNLKGVSEVRLELQFDSPKMALRHWLQPDGLRRRLERLLMRATLVINPFARQSLVIGIHVEHRTVASRRIQRRVVAYHVTTGLREIGVLSRSAFGMPVGTIEVMVDSWRHKGAHGLTTPKASVKKVAEMLSVEAETQVGDFISDWQRDSGLAGVLPLTPQPLDPRAGRECIRISLGSVAGPVEQKQESIGVDNVLPTPASKITVPMSRSTRTDLFAEVCGPSSLVQIALPELTRCAQEAALQVTLAAIENNPAAMTAPFRLEFLRRVTQFAGPLAAPPSVTLVAVRTTGPWQWFQ